MKKLLFTPGPTPIPEYVIMAMNKPIIHHRHDEFKSMLDRVISDLKYVFQTEKPVYIITASGTAAMETAVCNLLSIGDEIIVLNSGKFGQRWSEIASIYGVVVNEFKVEWGKTIIPEVFTKYLESHRHIKAVFLTHCETSTGVQHDIKNLSQIIHEKSDAIVVVDAISSLGGTELFTDRWGIDVVVSASQKGLMTPPGLSFISLNEKAMQKVFKSNIPKYYFDLKKSITSQRSKLTPWTPATTLLMGLEKALQIIRDTKLENIWNRNKQFSSMIRKGCETIGLEIFSESPSDILTAIYTPSDINQRSLLNLLETNYSIILANGQGNYKDKIFRISNIGNIASKDIDYLLKSLSEAMKILIKNK